MTKSCTVYCASTQFSSFHFPLVSLLVGPIEKIDNTRIGEREKRKLSDKVSKRRRQTKRTQCTQHRATTAAATAVAAATATRMTSRLERQSYWVKLKGNMNANERQSCFLSLKYCKREREREREREGERKVFSEFLSFFCCWVSEIAPAEMFRKIHTTSLSLSLANFLSHFPIHFYRNPFVF